MNSPHIILGLRGLQSAAAAAGYTSIVLSTFYTALIFHLSLQDFIPRNDKRRQTILQ